MTHPDRGAPHAGASVDEAGEWILARALGDAIAQRHAEAPGLIHDDRGADHPHPVVDALGAPWLDTDTAGRAAASALRFMGTTADLLDDELDAPGVPLYALVAQLPPESPENAPRLELLAAIRRELDAALPTPRRRRLWIQTYLRPRGVRLMRELTTDELRRMLEAVQTVVDAFRRRDEQTDPKGPTP